MLRSTSQTLSPRALASTDSNLAHSSTLQMQLEKIKTFIDAETLKQTPDKKFVVYYAVKMAIDNLVTGKSLNTIHSNLQVNQIYSKIISNPELNRAFNALIPSMVPELCFGTPVAMPPELSAYLINLNQKMQEVATQAMKDHATKVMGTFPLGSRKVQPLGEGVSRWGLGYDSKKGDPKINLNMKVVDAKKEQIACRHLAWEVLTGEMKDYHQAMADLKTVQPVALKANAFDNDRISFKADTYHPFHINEFGVVLYEICKNMQLEAKKYILLNSSTHLMSLVIEYKESGYISIKFYNPDRTTVHFRCLTDSLEKLKSARLIDFMRPLVGVVGQDTQQGVLDASFKIKSGVMAVYSNPNGLVGQGLQPTKFVVLATSQINIEELCDYAMTYNDEDIGKKIGHLITTSTNAVLSINDRGVVKTKYGYITRHLLINPLGLYGHTFAVRKFVDTIIHNKKLTLAKKIEVLQFVNIMDGIAHALDKGYIETLLQLIESITASTLDDDTKENILCISNNKYEFLKLILSNGNSEAIKILISFMQKSTAKIDTQRCSALFSLISKKGVNQFPAVMRSGKVNNVVAYSTALLGYVDDSKPQVISNNQIIISSTTAVEWLTDSLNDEMPELYVAIRSGLVDTVREFTTMILVTDKLTEQQKIFILIDEHNTAATGGVLPRTPRAHEAIDVFERTVREYDGISQQCKDEIFRKQRYNVEVVA